MPAPATSDVAQKGKTILGIQWGLFVAWIVAVFLLHYSYGTAIFWLGVIALLAQGAQKLSGLNVNRSWLILGVLLLVAGALVVLQANTEIFWSALMFVGFGVMIALAVAGTLFLGGRAVVRMIRKKEAEPPTPAPTNKTSLSN